MQKTNYNRLVSYICSILFIVSALLISIHYFSFNLDFYAKQHRTLTLYGQPINEYIGFSLEDLDELTSFTLDYLNDKESSLDKVMNIKGVDREVFTDDEKLHMVDVKNLNLVSKKVMYVSIGLFVIGIIYIIINKCSLKEYYNAAINVGKFLFVFISMIGIWIAIDFNSFWNFFHHIFFAGNDLWLLDLSKDILIMIVPPQFFFNLVTRIIIMFLVIVLIYYSVLYILQRKSNG